MWSKADLILWLMILLVYKPLGLYDGELNQADDYISFLAPSPSALDSSAPRVILNSSLYFSFRCVINVYRDISIDTFLTCCVVVPA